MRVGIVRTDLGRGVYIADIESRVQRNFSSQPPGQSRNVRRPSNAELDAAIAAFPAPVQVTGTDTAATVDTTANNTLRIRTSPSAAYTVIVVTAGATTAKTTIRDDLNAAFASAGIPVLASVVGTNQLRITTVSPDVGPSAYLQIDSVANGSTLNTAVGYAAGGVTVTGTSSATLLANLLAAVYPSPTTIDVSQATIIGANANWALLSAPDQAALALRLADLVAPQFVETGAVLLSFANGILSRLRSATYRPDGDRIGLPTGPAIAAVQNDGATPFTYP